MSSTAPLRLRLDGGALAGNWRWLAKTGGSAACGAAVKANGYGVGARDVVDRLAAAGCRDFFVAIWDEAAALGPLDPALSLSVLHGVRDEDLASAVASGVRPVLSTPLQVMSWRRAGGGACDVMVDTGMNRLGLSPAEAMSGLLDGLRIDTLMSHLACADEPDHPLNRIQLDRFTAVSAAIPARRRSLANSAGICLGADFAFDLTRPGLSLYGGRQVPAMEGNIRQVVFPEAQILQVRTLEAGDNIGYNATFTACRSMRVAILNIGYADGYLRGFSGRGMAQHEGHDLPVLGRVSMDLIAVDLAAAPDLDEGDWIGIDYDLPEASRQSGMSQYELLTGLGDRYHRRWL